MELSSVNRDSGSEQTSVSDFKPKGPKMRRFLQTVERVTSENLQKLEESKKPSRRESYRVERLRNEFRTVIKTPKVGGYDLENPNNARGKGELNTSGSSGGGEPNIEKGAAKGGEEGFASESKKTTVLKKLFFNEL